MLLNSDTFIARKKVAENNKKTDGFEGKNVKKYGCCAKIMCNNESRCMFGHVISTVILY